MEKLKGAVMKLLNNQANTPLSETHKARVEERLTQFLSPLHSPEHPPYAWMIERALQELNERGGSTEESISKFIRKEYDDLPWAHHTMLKHHLVQLCESGCIVLTQDKRYLLASGNSDLKVKRKSRRKWMKRKRGWDWEKKRSKRKLAIDPHLEQRLEKPRYRGRGRPPKRKRGASSAKKSDLEQRKTTKYLGRGRPRKTDLLE
ncbi:unnamed protein product [Coffea canephora]|uniref:H15 domain-containing protein n=1 Tax=Coffea canephora TaxID=49390 RepID=A0A068TX22_COFCA|nr:unnamed protein product [Coffea canephora]